MIQNLPYFPYLSTDFDNIFNGEKNRNLLDSVGNTKFLLTSPLNNEE